MIILPLSFTAFDHFLRLSRAALINPRSELLGSPRIIALYFSKSLTLLEAQSAELASSAVNPKFPATVSSTPVTVSRNNRSAAASLDLTRRRSIHNGIHALMRY